MRTEDISPSVAEQRGLLVEGHDTWNRSHHGWLYPYEIKQPEKRKPHFIPFKKPYPHSGSDPQRGNELPPKPQHQLLSESGGADYTCVNHPPGREGWWAALWGPHALEAWKWSAKSLRADMAAEHRDESVDRGSKSIYNPFENQSLDFRALF